MQEMTKGPSPPLLLLFLSVILGCSGDGSSGKSTVEIPELGVSMTIPDGWQLDHAGMCHKGDNTGLLMEEGLEGQPFETRAAKMSRQFGSTVISERKMTIHGRNAMEAVMNTAEGHRLHRLYVQMGEKIIVVSFVIRDTEYSKNEPALRQSIQSLKLPPK